ncbi:hypothetical protein [Streptomyces longisporoflavus]|uniref:Secreted protein n=1 Tax=Streptomyces longisporoflavus TaxID=28044 RepID=A0ABW7QWM9_9ACTN
MSRVASCRPAWLRAVLILLALLGTVLAPASPTRAAPAPPPAAVSTEPCGEAHQDTADSALRVPARRPVPHAAPATARHRAAHRSRPGLLRERPHVAAPRSVVLRC